MDVIVVFGGFVLILALLALVLVGVGLTYSVARSIEEEYQREQEAEAGKVNLVNNKPESGKLVGNAPVRGLRVVPINQAGETKPESGKSMLSELVEKPSTLKCHLTGALLPASSPALYKYMETRNNQAGETND